MQARHSYLVMQLDLDKEYMNENTILNFLGNQQSYEPEVSDLILRAVEPKDVVIDVGANIGYFTVMMGMLVGENGRVLSFEPGSNTLDRLKNNIKINDLRNITLIEQPVTDTIGETSFYINSDNSGGNSIWNPGNMEANKLSRENPQLQTLQTTTIDDEIERLELPPPRLIKVDVEGAEQKVLKGAHRLLRSHSVPYIIAELHEQGLQELGSSAAAFRKQMFDYGYDTFLLFMDGTFPKLLPPGVEITSNLFVNLLFSRLDDVALLWNREIHDPMLFFKPKE
jgi:FkbM family methyltransferase